ncbi:MAG TPA: tetratricopeptide repeat protein [Pyrinomonadaceae bacterium]|nr:tetratricopeptide repeat protein [Pyrinomonadaceae bacterium]
MYARTPLPTRLLSLSCAALLAVFLCQTVRAQSDSLGASDTGMGGRHTIEGRIFLPSGRRVERRMRVRLSSSKGESHMMSDDNGAFTFRRLDAGSYRVTVEADREFEAATESVDIFDMAGGVRRSVTGQIVNVQLHLQPRTDARPEARPGVVHAALAAVPKEARELYEKALRASAEGDSRKAVEHLRAALDAHPDFALAYNELGVQHMRLEQLDKASDAFRHALRLAPDVAVLRLNYGILLIRRRDFEGAEAELRRAIEKDDASTPAHLYRGRALIALKRLDEAERELQTALRLGGDGAPMAHRFLGALYIERGDAARAADSLETYLRLAPDAREATQIRELLKQLRAQAPDKK